MKKSELKQLIREVLDESTYNFNTKVSIDKLKADIAKSKYDTDYLDNASRFIDLAIRQLEFADYAAMLGNVSTGKDNNRPSVSREAIKDLIKQLETLNDNNPLMYNRTFKE